MEVVEKTIVLVGVLGGGAACHRGGFIIVSM